MACWACSGEASQKPLQSSAYIVGPASFALLTMLNPTVAFNPLSPEICKRVRRPQHVSQHLVVPSRRICVDVRTAPLRTKTGVSMAGFSKASLARELDRAKAKSKATSKAALDITKKTDDVVRAATQTTPTKTKSPRSKTIYKTQLQQAGHGKIAGSGGKIYNIDEAPKPLPKPTAGPGFGKEAQEVAKGAVTVVVYIPEDEMEANIHAEAIAQGYNEANATMLAACGRNMYALGVKYIEETNKLVEDLLIPPAKEGKAWAILILKCICDEMPRLRSPEAAEMRMRAAEAAARKKAAAAANSKVQKSAAG